MMNLQNFSVLNIVLESISLTLCIITLICSVFILIKKNEKSMLLFIGTSFAYITNGSGNLMGLIQIFI